MNASNLVNALERREDRERRASFRERTRADDESGRPGTRPRRIHRPREGIDRGLRTREGWNTFHNEFPTSIGPRSRTWQSRCRERSLWEPHERSPDHQWFDPRRGSRKQSMHPTVPAGSDIDRRGRVRSSRMALGSRRALGDWLSELPVDGA